MVSLFTMYSRLQAPQHGFCYRRTFDRKLIFCLKNSSMMLRDKRTKRSTDRDCRRSLQAPNAGNVARRRGGGENYSLPPIGIPSMQNARFLALLRLIFALKAKVIPSPIGIGMQDMSDLTLDLKCVRTQKPFYFGVKTLFFRSSSVFVHKNCSNSG